MKKVMGRTEKYLREFLNILSEDQVFFSYLTNTFLLNQIQALINDLNNGLKEESEIQKEVNTLIESLQLFSPEMTGLNEIDLSVNDFFNLIRSVKRQTLENLIEKRIN